MDKRYQVFISSTFQDLKGARQEVSQALLRAECFPAGMELFPAADEEQFEFIKQVIDQSDYYIVISAGRYGSIHPEKGLSYTELEYDYAAETGKPVIRLLHKDPFKKLAGEFIEQSDDGREMLRTFREKLSKGTMVNFWEDPKELGQLVVFGLMDARKRKPAIGWVRADGRATPEAERDVAELKQRIAELELEIERNKKSIVDFDKEIAEMSEEITLQIISYGRDAYGGRKEISRSMDKIILGDFCMEICIAILKNFTEWRIKSHLGNTLPTKLKYEEEGDQGIAFLSEDFMERILRRLESLGFVISSAAESSGTMRNTYQIWELTKDARRWVSGVAAQS